VPARGAKNHSATQHINANPSLNAWVDVDTSYKQYDISRGDALREVAFDALSAREALKGQATIDTSQGSAQGISEPTATALLNSYAQRVNDFLASRPALTSGDLVRTRSIRRVRAPLLAGSLPYKAAFVGVPVDTLAASLRHRVELKLFASELDRSLDAPAISFAAPLSQIGARRLSVSYEPATAADAQAIQAAIDANAESLPAYLIQVRPVLRLDGATVATGPVSTMGTPQLWSLDFSDPAGLNSGTADFRNGAGDEIVFAVNGNGLTADAIEQRFATGEAINTAMANLEYAGWLYWLEHDLMDEIAASFHGVRTMRMPSAAQFAAPLTVRYFFGIARAGSYLGRIGDGRRVRVAVAGGTEANRRAFMTQAGIQGSSVEGSVLDQAFERPDETSLSTTQVLAIAARQGMRIFAINATNIATALPQLATSAAVKEDIANAIALGRVAVVPEGDLDRTDYRGTGYVLFDPVTGEGAYLIDGGLNGLIQKHCLPQAKPPAEAPSFSPMAALLGFFGSPEAFLRTLAPGGFADEAAEKAAREIAEREYKKLIERLVKRTAGAAAIALLSPGAGLAISIVLAVDFAIEMALLIATLKLQFAEMELQTRLRDHPDCKCRPEPKPPECSCIPQQGPQKPPLKLPAVREWEKRTEIHHLCANSTSFNQFPGTETRLYKGDGSKSPSYDVFSDITKQACEVKTTSFANKPQGKYEEVYRRWQGRLRGNQIKDQARWAKECKYSYCIIVNQKWLEKEAIDALRELRLQGQVYLRLDCNSYDLPPDPLEPNALGVDY
jgi:hypothetical protein